MRFHGIFALLTCSVVVGGCGGDETMTDTTGTPGDTANALTFRTGEFEAPAGDTITYPPSTLPKVAVD